MIRSRRVRTSIMEICLRRSNWRISPTYVRRTLVVFLSAIMMHYSETLRKRRSPNKGSETPFGKTPPSAVPDGYTRFRFRVYGHPRPYVMFNISEAYITLYTCTGWRNDFRETDYPRLKRILWKWIFTLCVAYLSTYIVWALQISDGIIRRTRSLISDENETRFLFCRIYYIDAWARNVLRTRVNSSPPWPTGRSE